MECNALNIKILLLLFAKRRSLNTLALPRIFTDCFEYPIPYLTQSTQKILAKFSCPKKSQKQKFQTQKIISPITWIPEYPPPPHLLLRYSIHWPLISGRSRGGPPLYWDQTEAKRAKKSFFETVPHFTLGSGLGSGLPPPPPPLSEGLDPPLLMITSCGGSTWPKFGHWMMPLLERRHTGLVGKTNKSKKIMVHSPITRELGPRKYMQHNCWARYNATESLKSHLFTDIPFSLQRFLSIQTNKTVGNLLTIWIPNLVQWNLDLMTEVPREWGNLFVKSRVRYI